MSTLQSRAAELHKNVPADWYARSIKENIFQRYWHTRRFEEIGKMAEPTKGKVLDIGSADGTFTKIVLEKSGASKVIGIDVLGKSVQYAKRRFARSKKLSFRIADAHDLPYPDRSFDAVFCLETMEHVEDPARVAQEMHRVLKDDGYAVVLVPNENLLFHIVWGIWLLGPGKIWKGTHIQDLSADEILTTLQKGGFRIKETKRFILGMLQAVKVVKR